MRTIRCVALALVALLAFQPAAAWAQQDRPPSVPSELRARARALMEMKPGDIPGLEALAEAGDADAMALLGEAHALGFAGLPVDEVRAVALLRRAAGAGLPWARKAADFFEFKAHGDEALGRAAGALDHARAALAGGSPEATADPDLVALGNLGLVDAQMLLGAMHDTGRGAPLDHAAAAGWYGRAAERGEGSASLALASMYGSGRGVPRDAATAVAYLAEASERGVVPAQRRLAEALMRGDGVGQDPVEAMKWLILAGFGGDREAGAAVLTMAEALGEAVFVEAAGRARGWIAARPARPR